MNKVALVILDGFGISPEEDGNAPLLAKTPFIDEIINKCPKALIKAASEEVGLPWGESGNSEVGHSNIGAGQVVMQSILLINDAFKSGEIFARKVWQNLASPGTLHIIGLISDGGVHSHIDHLISTLKELKDKDVNVKIHFIADGRDASEKSALKFLDRLKPYLIDKTSIETVSGRFYAMDRDKRWERTQLAYETIALGRSEEKFDDPATYIDDCYKSDKTDEFILPAAKNGYQGINDGDKILMLNFRTDRMIQLTKVFSDKNFDAFETIKKQVKVFSMTNYEDKQPVDELFSAIDLSKEIFKGSKSLSDALNEKGVRQLRVAETEKYAHITYFFNGGRKDPTELERYELIESKKVETYDQSPEMSAREIVDKVLGTDPSGFDFLLINFANPDMLGHTGKLKETIVSLEFLDGELRRLVDHLLRNNFHILITADHGNCESMICETTGGPDKEHSTNPVPLIYIRNDRKSTLSKDQFFVCEPTGILADIAPTVLALLGLEQPPSMTGINLSDSLQ